MSEKKVRSVEQALVHRCLAGDRGAWQRLYLDYGNAVRDSIRTLLRTRVTDEHLVEEVASRVWSWLLSLQGRPLRAFDPDRGSLANFLALFARQQLHRLARRRVRRAMREVALGASHIADSRTSPIPTRLMMDEFMSRLSNKERRFLHSHLLGARDAGDAITLSATNTWKTKQRVLSKFRTFFQIR
jgi:DNA-directed RNA polymerase specialized sigma24 family protein